MTTTELKLPPLGVLDARRDRALGTLKANPRAWGMTGRAAILAATVARGATVATIAELLGITERTFRYRTDGTYLKALLDGGYLELVGDRVILGPAFDRG